VGYCGFLCFGYISWLLGKGVDRMETKEAIEFVEWAKDVFYGANTSKKENIEFIKKGNEVKELFQRGEKFEKVEKGIKQYCLILERQSVLKEIIRLEQKYFPKGVV